MDPGSRIRSGPAEIGVVIRLGVGFLRRDVLALQTGVRPLDGMIPRNGRTQMALAQGTCTLQFGDPFRIVADSPLTKTDSAVTTPSAGMRLSRLARMRSRMSD